MNKYLFCFLCLFFVFVFSCKEHNDLAPRAAISNVNTISVIIDNQLWNGVVGESIRDKFASPVIGLPQEEPLFTINQYPLKLMEGFINDSRIIIVVKKEKNSLFQIKKNQYASPQNVFHIYGKSTEDLLKIIEKNTSKIIKTIKEAEILESQRVNRKSLLNQKVIKDTFKISLEVPSGYSYALQRKNFLWLKKEIISGNLSLLIFEVPLKAIKNKTNIFTNIISVRDSISKLYIHGTNINSQMIIEEGYSPYLFRLKIDGKQTFETRGTWELKNDFMSGPFVNYAIVDEKNDRILFLEGFSYSSSKEKRDLMHELESIIKSVQIL